VWLDARTKSTVDNFKAKVPESKLEEIRVGLIITTVEKGIINLVTL
jgi:hypothetical protein